MFDSVCTVILNFNPGSLVPNICPLCRLHTAVVVAVAFSLAFFQTLIFWHAMKVGNLSC